MNKLPFVVLSYHTYGYYNNKNTDNLRVNER